MNPTRRQMTLTRYKREISAALAYAILLVTVCLIAPSFFTLANFRDLALNNAPVLLIAIGMTVVILSGEIDISVGSQFAVAGVSAGLLAKAGLPIWMLLPAVLIIGATMGAINGLLVGRLGLPSIVVTLAMLVIWRDALRWSTEGAWVQNLPANFQWFGLGQVAGECIIIGESLLILLVFSWMLRNLGAGRAVYAVGSDREAARLAGIDPTLVNFWVFVLIAGLTGIAALLNAVRFSAVPAETGLGLELKAVAAVVVGGAAITGGRGSLIGTFIGVALLGTIGTALTYVGINPFWEKAVQGTIILAALVSDHLLGHLEHHVRLKPARAA
jgi:rhamnose transport system permease protein